MLPVSPRWSFAMLLALSVAGCAGRDGVAPESLDLAPCSGAGCPCRVNGDCLGDARICDPNSGQCVGCLSAQDCPVGKVCERAACVDSCSGATCGSCRVCERDAGVCVAC